ncbi:hypothetical protein PENTCL1PPCAC_24268, partial [Pristionchus entomophagus]
GAIRTIHSHLSFLGPLFAVVLNMIALLEKQFNEDRLFFLVLLFSSTFLSCYGAIGMHLASRFLPSSTKIKAAAWGCTVAYVMMLLMCAAVTFIFPTMAVFTVLAAVFLTIFSILMHYYIDGLEVNSELHSSDDTNGKTLLVSPALSLRIDKRDITQIEEIRSRIWGSRAISLTECHSKLSVDVTL